MMKIAVILAVALSSSVAVAADTATSTGATDATTTGKPTEKGAGDVYLAKEFWQQHAKDGYLSKDDLASFKGADGKTVDMKTIDMDNDGKVSEREWNAYQQTAGASGLKEGSTGPSGSK